MKRGKQQWLAPSLPMLMPNQWTPPLGVLPQWKYACSPNGVLTVSHMKHRPSPISLFKKSNWGGMVLKWTGERPSLSGTGSIPGIVRQGETPRVDNTKVDELMVWYAASYVHWRPPKDFSTSNSPNCFCLGGKIPLDVLAYNLLLACDLSFSLHLGSCPKQKRIACNCLPPIQNCSHVYGNHRSLKTPVKITRDCVSFCVKWTILTLILVLKLLGHHTT